MSVFTNFRVRNRERDRSTDVNRFDSLLQLVRKLGQDATGELKGLKARYEQAGADAAFAVMEEENEGPTAGGNERIGALTATMMNFADRVRYLERQVAYFEELEREVIAAAERIVLPVDENAQTPDG